MNLLTLQVNSNLSELTQMFRHVVAVLPNQAPSPRPSPIGWEREKAGEKIRDHWRLFTTCAVADSLLKAVTEAARNAASGSLVLVSLTRSGFDRFQDYQEYGQDLCRAVKSIGRGVKNGDPNIHGKSRVT